MRDLFDIAREYCAALAAWEPGTHSGEHCVSVVELLATVEKATSAARARGAARVAELAAHRGRGYADVGDWVAAVTGSTVPEARAELSLVRSADECPATIDAWAAGHVSAAQAAEIMSTARQVPGSECELLDIARTSGLRAVRERGRKRRTEAVDPERLHAAQRAARRFEHWRDELGMVCGRFALTPEVGLPLVRRIDRAADRLWREARRSASAPPPGTCERRAAFAADAFARLADASSDRRPAAGSGTRAGPRVDLVIVQELAAARRGHAHAGELCHIVGGGPIPASLVAELAKDAFVKGVLHDGKQVTHVAHFGRKLTAEMRTALELGPAPGFDGRRCCEDGCDRVLGLETDHLVPLAAGGPTSMDNLADRCGPHHWEKTRRDRADGLLRPGGADRDDGEDRESREDEEGAGGGDVRSGGGGPSP
jgi:hypothetical protein